MFKCCMNRNTMNASVCAPVSAFACNCSENHSANKGILRILGAAVAVSFFVIAALARIIINEIIISLLAVSDDLPVMARA